MSALRSAVLRFAREPLAHFLVIGGLLFALYGWTHRGVAGVEPSHEVAISFDDLRTLELMFESQWHRAPTGQEFAALLEDKIREEVLYREGLAMGLDKDDVIVKRRMAQKVEFLAEDVAAAHEPSTAELQAWFAKNADRFALPGRVSFRHLFFSFDKRGRNAQADATAALARLKGQPENSPLGPGLADPFMFQDTYGDRTAVDLAKEFGPTFATGVFRLTPHAWAGPVESGFGWHLVYVDTFIPGRVPEFEKIEPDVKTAWLADQKDKAWREAYAKIRARYTVLLPAAPEDAAQFPAAKPKKPQPAISSESVPQ